MYSIFSFVHNCTAPSVKRSHLTFFTALEDIIGLFESHTSRSNNQIIPLGHNLEDSQNQTFSPGEISQCMAPSITCHTLWYLMRWDSQHTHRQRDNKHINAHNHITTGNYTMSLMQLFRETQIYLPPPVVCHSLSQIGSRCLAMWRCPSACCPSCPFLWWGFQRSHVGPSPQIHPQPYA